ncbi:MAG: hypothetical protein HYX28_10685 [Candidatus Koribacter versatilis]|uniref:DUF6677 domain-containing protein n=1 Tax=Candidatus Korobacter versatilis TaxID=658062 RepID=A0A932A9P3_9BACT|nr:hypothetical protein [Candidatus Koribacter versatilis]
MPETIEHLADKHYPLTPMAIIAPIVGWLIPGAGHLIQKKWIRGALLMLSVGAMFSLGIAMQAKIYQGNTGDLLDILGFLGDAGGGALYLLARAQGWGAGAINTVTANYGTVFVIVAGLLNIVSAVDAHQIALGKKP